ncbi:hypothetical protein ACFOUP_01145 [Belliella kenyensis]|uniref:Phage protein n=1 Tax=Belliella kenyensis TaxID=1472724 RepID=A0ABV8EGE6_9BACT|nr:hypothetical protein [Belliella kenyensis]MCH7401200.1 hypothetical protein [Belliella kenyensis]MDN3604197.1 hypothetical protein [Belliella kenyensis]
MKYTVDIPILELAILEMIRMNPNQSFDPAEVVMWLFPQSWEYFVDDVVAEAEKMYDQGKISLIFGGESSNKTTLNKSAFKITAKK